MNHIFALHALRELAINDRARREIDRIGRVFMGTFIVVVLSFSAFPYLT